MAIIENIFTIEELTTAAAANPDLENVLQTYLTGREFVIKPKADWQKEISAGVSGEVSKIAGRMEADVLEHFKDLGITKEKADEKYYDLFKKGATAAKGKITELQAEIAKLQKSIADGKGNEQLQESLKLLETRATQYEAQIKNYKDVVVPEFEKKITNIQIGSVIEAAKNGITWRKDVPASMLNSALDFEKNALLASAKHVNGVLTFYDNAGTPMLDDKGNVASAEWLLRKKFADSIETAPAPGADTKTPQSSGHKHPLTGQDILIPAGLKNQQELVEYLTVKLALSPVSKEVIEITKASKLPLL